MIFIVVLWTLVETFILVSGYANTDGILGSWINILGYIKLDMNPEAPNAPVDERELTSTSRTWNFLTAQRPEAGSKG